MKNIITIMKNCQRRSWVVILICIGLGLLMGYEQKALGGSLNENLSKIKVVVVAHEDTAISKHLAHFLEQQYGMEVSIGSNYDDYTSDLLDRNISAIIELPAGYYDQCIREQKAFPVEITTIDNYENEAYLNSYLNSYLSNMDLIFQAAGKDKALCDTMITSIPETKATVIGADETLKQKSVNESGFTLTVGFYLNFIWILGFFIGLNILSDRIDGTFLRIQSSTIKGYQYMIGTALFYNLAGLLIPIVFLGYLKINHIDFGFSYGYAFLLILLMQLIVIGISTILSLLINSKIGVVVGTYVFGAIIAILGGAYFDIDAIDGAMAKVIRLTPTYYYMDCVRQLQANVSFNPAFNLMILILFAVLSTLIAIALFSKHMKTND